MSAVTVSTKGWVVIPREIRERHGIRAGDKVHVIDFGGRISIIPATKGDPIEGARGMFTSARSMTGALLDDRREEIEREQRTDRNDRERSTRRARRPA